MKAAIAVRLLAFGLVTYTQADEAGGDATCVAAIEKAREVAAASRSGLFDKYAGAVERLQNQFQAEGDLKNALLAKAVVERARQSRVFGNEEFPGISKIREILQTELRKIEVSELSAVIKARTGCVDRLKKRVAELTKAGDLEFAKQVDEARQREEGVLGVERAKYDRLTSSGDGAGTSTGSDVATGPGATGAGSVALKDGEVILGTREMVGGTQKLRGKVQIGNRVTGKKEERGQLSIKQALRVSGGRIHTNFGLLTIEESLFDGVALTEAIQGSFRAKGSIFDGCTFAHDSVWAVDLWGAKWVLDECVVNDSFVKGWDSGWMGMKITNCTFIDVEFPTYRPKRDIVTESKAEWRTIKNCRFIECKVPVSVLVSTENCVFEDCRFIKEKEFPVNSELTTTVHYEATSEPKIPKFADNLIFKLVPASAEMGSIGCPGFYTMTGNKPRFR